MASCPRLVPVCFAVGSGTTRLRPLPWTQTSGWPGTDALRAKAPQLAPSLRKIRHTASSETFSALANMPPSSWGGASSCLRIRCHNSCAGQTSGASSVVSSRMLSKRGASYFGKVGCGLVGPANSEGLDGSCSGLNDNRVIFI